MGSPVARRYDISVPENQRKLDLVEDLAALADKAGISLTHMAMAFTLAHPAVTSAIIGPRTPEQLLGLLEGADTRLGEDTLDAIDDLVAPGTVVFDFDRGWSPPWMEPAARRRKRLRSDAGPRSR
jgi:aryl-alcohol dehydrogenase-like predicted oxidoreductase